jgi:hypothetical protein
MQSESLLGVETYHILLVTAEILSLFMSYALVIWLILCNNTNQYQNNHKYNNFHYYCQSSKFRDIIIL